MTPHMFRTIKKTEIGSCLCTTLPGLFAILVVSMVCVFAPSTMAAQGKTILVVAPHPDDEALCCSGVIYQALQQGNKVYVAVVTNGDYGSTGTSYGLQREGETMAGMGILGVPAQNVIFLGYGDQALQGLYQSTSPSTVMPSSAGLTQTYANAGLGGMSYHQYLTGTPGQYTRQTLISDMQALLQNLKPSDIYTTSVWDDHPDHVGTFNFLVEALLSLRKQGVSMPVRVHETLVHAPCSSCGSPNNANYLWPGGGVGVVPTFFPTQPYSEPYYLSSMTSYEWDNREDIPVPAVMQNTVQTANLKAQVISQYVSQGADWPTAYLFSWAKRDEWFWIRDFVTNIAGMATVTDSSDTPSAGEVGASVVDGFIQGYPGYAPWEWASNGELAGAWIKLTWPNAVTVSNVVLYNRQDGVDQVLSGTLSFSDGSSVPVGQLPISGNGYLVTFPARAVTSMTFTVTNAVGMNIGLTEIEVFGTATGTSLNHPQIFKGPVASAAVTADQYGLPYLPTLTDAQQTNLSVTAFDVAGSPLSYAWSSDMGVIGGTGAAVAYTPPIVAVPTVATPTVTVSDAQGGTIQNSTFLLITPSNNSGIAMSTLHLSAGSVASGSSVTGTVTLNAPAHNGAIVALSSSNAAVASVPATVAVAPGANSATFTVNTTYVTTTTAVTVSASLGGVTTNAALSVLAPTVTVSSVAVSPLTVGGGNPATGTVTLTGAAPTGGAVVALSSSNASVASVPASVTVPAGATSANFTVTTQSVSSASQITVSAAYVGQKSTGTLRVAPAMPPNLATIATVSVSSQNVSTQQQGIKAIDGIIDGSPTPGDYTKEWATNGQLAGAWITLAWPAPVTATSVILCDRPNLTDNITAGTLTFSDGSSLPVGTLPNNGAPLTVTFAAKTFTSMTFTVNSAVGQNIGLAEIAVIGTIAPASQVNGLSVSPSSLIAGNPATGTVTLNGVAPSSGTVVTLSSNNGAVTVPASVTVPGGATLVNFPLTTSPVNATTTVTVSATYGGTQQAVMTVAPVAISSLAVSPTMVAGGAASSTGTITLNGPAPTGGATVTLSSSLPAATVPTSIVIPAGASTASFTISTTAVASTANVTISASYRSQQTAALLVTPQISGGSMVQFSVDNFNRPDGGLGANWTTIMDADSSPVIHGQQVQSNYGRAKALFYGGLSWPANQYSQTQILASNGGSSGPTVRMTSYGNFYAGTVGSLGTGNANAYILIDSQESQSVLASTGSATILAGDYIRLSITGTTITLTNVTRSTTLLTVSDTTLSAGYPGMYVGNGGTLANWSGGLSTAPPALTQLAADNFNRSNAPNLGSNWAVGPGYYAIQIVNNQILSAGQGQAPGQGHGKEYYQAAAFPGDQWSQAQVISASNDVNGAIVRYQGSVDTHYVAFVSRTGSPGTCSVNIDRDLTGNPVVLATDSTYCSVAPGDYVRLQVQGSLLTYVDVTTGSLLLTVIDSQITGGSPGWSLNPGGGTPTAANWSAGQVGP